MIQMTTTFDRLQICSGRDNTLQPLQLRVVFALRCSFEVVEEDKVAWRRFGMSA